MSPAEALAIAGDERTRAPRARQHSHSVPDRALTAAERAEAARRRLEVLPSRPRTRGECIDVPRPCPWVGCKANLFLETTQSGSLKLLHGPDVEPGDRPADLSCALDIAERPQDENDGATLEVIGNALGLSRERIRQVENRAMKTLRRRGITLADLLPGGRPRREPETAHDDTLPYVPRSPSADTND